MKAQRIAVVMLAALASAFSAQARQVDPGGKIEVECSQSNAVRMAAVSRAVENSHYWAPRAARRQMLELAQQACAQGASVVTFVPSADQRFVPEGAQVAETAARNNRAGT